MRCDWQVVEGRDHPTFRCRVCRHIVEVWDVDPVDFLARTSDCGGLPEDSPPAFRLRMRVRGYLARLKRWALR